MTTPAEISEFIAAMREKQIPSWLDLADFVKDGPDINHPSGRIEIYGALRKAGLFMEQAMAMLEQAEKDRVRAAEETRERCAADLERLAPCGGHPDKTYVGKDFTVSDVIKAIRALTVG